MEMKMCYILDEGKFHVERFKETMLKTKKLCESSLPNVSRKLLPKIRKY